jgi:hypothetical protein
VDIAWNRYRAFVLTLRIRELPEARQVQGVHAGEVGGYGSNGVHGVLCAKVDEAPESKNKKRFRKPKQGGYEGNPALAQCKFSSIIDLILR